jgi:hypothetical protein
VTESMCYRLYMSETMSISASAAAIFSAEEGWGRAPPPKRKDIFGFGLGGKVKRWKVCGLALSTFVEIGSYQSRLAPSNNNVQRIIVSRKLRL